jgi:putative chitinase
MTNQFTSKLPSPISKLNEEDQLELKKQLEILKYETGDSLNDLLYAFNQFKKKEQLTHPGILGNLTLEILRARIEDSIDDLEIESDVHPNILLLKTELIKPSVINWNDFSCPVSKYFTVGEVTKYSKNRIPTDNTIKNNIIKLAQELDKAREFIKLPLIVTSWYRPPAVNASVRGATNSQHLYGKAVDLQCKGMSTIELEKILLKYWYGALGKGAARLNFVHLDTRNGKGWKTGGEKGVRFNY